MSDLNPYQTTLAETKANERKRCADLVRARAEIAREAAAGLRKDGTYSGQSLHLTWPFVRNVPCVAPRWERAARDQEAFAEALDFVRQAILDGKVLKEPYDD